MNERDRIRRAYDDVAEAYAAGRSDGGREMEVLAEFLARLPEDPRILDAGCGQGTPVLRRLSADAAPLGLDFSREQLRLADENVPDASLAQADVTRLPLADDAFDAVTAYHTLIHVPAEDREAVVTELARVLRPGGYLLVSEGPGEWTGTNPDWLDTGVEMRWHVAGAEATRSRLQETGFGILEEWDVDEDERWVFLAARLEG